MIIARRRKEVNAEMELTLSYGTKIRSSVSAMDAVLDQTAKAYDEAVAFFLDVCEKEYPLLKDETSISVKPVVEKLAHATKDNPSPKYAFDEKFPGFPSYLRRAAIAAAFGKVKGFHSLVENWEEGGRNGKKPSFPKRSGEAVTLYNGNAFRFVDDDGKDVPRGTITKNAKIKVFCTRRQLTQDRPLTNKERKAIASGKADFGKPTWDWLPVSLKNSDVEYLKRKQADGAEVLCPSIVKRGKRRELSFPVKNKAALSDAPVFECVAVCVDLGINSPATCSVMKADGTVVARRFFRPASDMGRLSHRIAMVSRAQSKGSRKTPTLWRMADNANRKLSDGTADFIISVAEEFGADVIVFEHLDVRGKKRGSKKARLHHWRAEYVQKLTANRAHARGIRVATVCAWNTSKLAYDGSGRVERGVGGNYSVCRFTTGKIYNCDLSASYNVGARYFIREIEKTIPAREWSELAAKVPELSKRSTCTLSSLIRLDAELSSSMGGSVHEAAVQATA